MGELKLGPWQDRPYGVFARGVVESSNGHQVPIRVRSPHEAIDDNSLPKLVAHDGLTTGHESMATTARAAAQLGYVAVTYDNTNLGIREPLSLFNPRRWTNPLDKNADDGLLVSESLPAGKLTQHGLSMGGAVGTLVASRTDREVAWLNLISPGAYTHDIDTISRLKVTKAFCHESIDELYASLADPATAWRVALDSLRNCCARPFAVSVELRQLLHQTMYDDLRKFRSTQPDAKTLLAYTSRDRLVPATELLASIDAEEGEHPGSLIDLRFSYEGTHGRSATDERVTRDVLLLEERDRHVPDAA